jgi:hypothetical protein
MLAVVGATQGTVTNIRRSIESAAVATLALITFRRPARPPPARNCMYKPIPGRAGGGGGGSCLAPPTFQLTNTGSTPMAGHVISSSCYKVARRAGRSRGRGPVMDVRKLFRNTHICSIV